MFGFFGSCPRLKFRYFLRSSPYVLAPSFSAWFTTMSLSFSTIPLKRFSMSLRKALKVVLHKKIGRLSSDGTTLFMETRHFSES